MRWNIFSIQIALIAFIVPSVVTSTATATTYHVGPTQPFANFQALPDLVAGDLVLVDGGGAVYPGNINFFDEGHGTAAQPIILRGIIINNQRPVISGGTNCIRLDNDYYTLENFEITGGTSRGIYTAGHGNVIEMGGPDLLDRLVAFLDQAASPTHREPGTAPVARPALP